MAYEITIENKYGEQLKLTSNPNYIVKATGLSPVNSNIVTATVANYGGERYMSSRQQKRNIVLTIYVNYPVETNRINLYKYIKSDDYVKLYYKNSTRNVYIEGYVESFEADLFEQTQTAQVSIICPQPNFIDMTSNKVTNSHVTSNFHFPFNSEIVSSETGEYHNLTNGLIHFTDFIATPETTQAGTPSPNNAIVWSGLGDLVGTHYQSKLCLGAGKRNLYTGSKDFSGDRWSALNADQWLLNGDLYKGFTVAERTGTWMGLGQYLTGTVGDIFTMSGYYKCTAGARISFYSTRGDSVTTCDGDYVGNAQEWTQFSVTFEVTVGGSLEPRLENSVDDTSLYVCGLKLEYSDQMTDWTPAPEDNINVGKVFTAVTIPLGEQTDGVNLIRGGQSLVNDNNNLITNAFTDINGCILTDENGRVLYE